jgi:predicted nucleic acid-binding protein
MNSFYLDTNFFLYLSDKTSPFNLRCRQFIKNSKHQGHLLLTSTETIQEIIHYSKNIKQLHLGLKVAEETLNLVTELLPVSLRTIDIYLKYAALNKNASSRDLIHLAVCIENKLNKIVTFDSDFRKFKEVDIITPKEAVFD